MVQKRKSYRPRQSKIMDFMYVIFQFYQLMERWVYGACDLFVNSGNFNQTPITTQNSTKGKIFEFFDV